MALTLAVSAGAQAAEASVVAEGHVTVRDFRFADGGSLADMRLHCETLGTPRRDASGSVIMLAGERDDLGQRQTPQLGTGILQK